MRFDFSFSKVVSLSGSKQKHNTALNQWSKWKLQMPVGSGKFSLYIIFRNQKPVTHLSSSPDYIGYFFLTSFQFTSSNPMSPFLRVEPMFAVPKLQQHAVQSAKCIKAQYRVSGKQTPFQTLPQALDLPTMPVSFL